ncbi:MAG: OmpA family protein [Planctomycetota bacterium]|jgi:chemotaxis protein MotB
MGNREIRIKEVEDGLDGAPMWITTFVDMVSLLVTFFILLYTFSSIRAYDAFTYPKNILATSGLFKGAATDTIIAPADDLMLAMDIHRGSRIRHTRPVEHLRENLEEMGQALSDDDIEVDLRDADDGLRVRFSRSCSFLPGSAKVSRSLARALRELAETAQFYPVTVVIEGHTDDRFVPTPTHPMAADLSLARAASAAEVMIEDGGYARDLIAVEAYGTDVPRLEGAATASERTINRRVEVRLVTISNELSLASRRRRDG